VDLAYLLTWPATRRGADQEVRMDWMKQVGDVLDRYGDANPTRPPETVDRDFDLFAQNAPPAAVSEGLSAAFRSDQTPEFSQMASQLFGRASGSQRATMLNALLAAVGPMVLQQILARRQRGPSAGPGQGQAQGGGGLGDVLGKILRGDGPPKVTPEVADQVTPQEVEEIAREAEKKDPSVIDRISEVYAQQPQLLKVLGGAALAIALGRMAQKRNTL
jgi:hypothetical protein